MKIKQLSPTAHRNLNSPHMIRINNMLLTAKKYLSGVDIWGGIYDKVSPTTVDRALRSLNESKLADREWATGRNGSRYYVYKLNNSGRKAARAVLNG